MKRIRISGIRGASKITIDNTGVEIDGKRIDYNSSSSANPDLTEPVITFDQPSMQKILKTCIESGQEFMCPTEDYVPKHGKSPGTTSCDECSIAARKLYPVDDAHDPLRDAGKVERYCPISGKAYDMAVVEKELNEMGAVIHR